MPQITENPHTLAGVPTLNSDVATLIAHALVVFFATEIPAHANIYRIGSRYKSRLVTYILSMLRITKDPQFINHLCNQIRRWLVLYTNPGAIKSQLVMRSVMTRIPEKQFLDLRQAFENHGMIFRRLREISVHPLALVSIPIDGEEKPIWQIVTKIIQACGKISADFPMERYMTELFTYLRAQIHADTDITRLAELSLSPINPDYEHIEVFNGKHAGYFFDIEYRPSVYRELMGTFRQEMRDNIVPDINFTKLNDYLDLFIEALQPLIDWQEEEHKRQDAPRRRSAILNKSQLCFLIVTFVSVMVYLLVIFIAVLKLPPKIVIGIGCTLTLCFCFYLMIMLCKMLKNVPKSIFNSGREAVLNLSERISRILRANTMDESHDEVNQSLLYLEARI